MAIEAHPKARHVPALARPSLRLIKPSRPPAQVHLFTYVVGSALFWTLWGAVSVSAERWYWWPVAPFAGWTLVLILHLWHVYGSVHS